MRNSYLEERALSLVGKDIYITFVKEFTENNRKENVNIYHY